MTMSPSQKRERTEDQVARNAVGCDDQPAGFYGILDQDFTVYRTAEPGDQFCLGHACIHLGVTTDVARPATGQDTDLFRKADLTGYHPPFFYQFKFLGPSSLRRLLQVSGGIFSRAQFRGGRCVRGDPLPQPF